MPSPFDIEKSFAGALLDGAGEVPGDLTSHSAPIPQDRFNIYRNNVHVGLIGAMAARYPVVNKLVGDEFFQGLARTFIRANPPTSPLIIHYGDGFADFLKTFEHVADLPYLKDVAALERLRMEAYHAADATPLTAEEMAEIDRDRLGATRFQLHPSLRTLKSDYPVVSIWQANIEGRDLGMIDLRGGGENALIIRPLLDVEVLQLPSASCDFARSLGSAISLEEANIQALEGEPGFDLQLTLSALIRCGAFIGFSYDD